MDCPRCGLRLSPQVYETESVSFCTTCWGYWLTRSQLENIVNKVQYKFSKYERDAVLTTMTREGDADRQGSEAQPVNCPQCRKPMERKRYESGCPVKIDECPEHGIWLDTGEIKDLQIFVEKNLEKK
ncbi:MAG: zf-TFIIB domain-containing protein [Planctomycetota bacterium]|jgi:Zn-finger nucleic acid-binding protein